MSVGTITDCFSKQLISSALLPRNTLSFCVQWAWKTKDKLSAILDCLVNFRDCRADVQKDIPFDGHLGVNTLFMTLVEVQFNNENNGQEVA